MFMDELRDTFNIDVEPDEGPTLRWIRRGNYIINPLRYRNVIDNRDINGIIQAMKKKDYELIIAIAPIFGNFQGTRDEIMSLYWWGIIYPDINNNIRRSNEDIIEINKMNTEQLISIVPDNWPYPRDRASIIFKLLTGYNPPRADATNEPRYNSIIVTNSDIIMKLADLIYNYFGRNNGGHYDFYSHYSPYRHVALQEPSIMEPFVIQYSKNRINELSLAMGMKIPEEIINKEKYYFDNLKHYNIILSRDPNNVGPVPDLENIPRRQIKALLEKYTDNELIEGYEMLDRYRTNYRYTSRGDLIDRIIRTRSRTNNRWQFRKRTCINANRDNVFELDHRNDSNEDPLISYGTMKNYRCWNRDELEGIWEVQEDGTVSFMVPDWVQGDPYQTFPIGSITQLRSLLQETNDQVFDNLRTTINEGIRAMNNADARVRGFRNHYQGIHNDQQRLVREYLVWMFSTSMYMRYWKGPGNPYPTVWREGGRGEDRCNAATRTQNVNNQFGIRTNILERMPAELEQWVLSFPRIEYNFNERTSTVGAEMINFIIEQAQMGNFCLAEGSDHLVQTSYYLTTQILNTDLNGFNRTVNEFLGGINQGDFNPTEVTITGHIDPHHRLRTIGFGN